MDLKKTLVYLQIALQIFPPTSLIYLSATQQSYAKEQVATIKTANDTASDTEQSLARAAVQAGTIFGAGNNGSVNSALTSAATGAASAEVQEWLSQFGNARINISTDEHFSLQDSEVDVLMPLYDNKTNLLFTQLGGRRIDDRNIINAGLGYRHFSDRWMWGTNVFYDRQISDNQHQRLGLGSELGWNYLKLSANGYFRLSDWKSSGRYEDYDERVANGFDVRANGYLPAWPQLGASVVYEQYFGDNVGLFSDDEEDRQKDPHAITLGLDYTPVPLVTFGVDQKWGKGGQDEFQVNLALNWTPGVPMRDQLDPAAVAAQRTLLGSRQALVERNNNIVLEYRKQNVISLSLPPELTGDEKTTQRITAKVKAKHGVDRIEWQGDSFFKNGGTVEESASPSQYNVTLPLWQSNGQNSYMLTATAWDKNGNASSPSHIQVTVNGVNVSTLQSVTTVSPATLPADGSSTSMVTVTLSRENGERAAGLASRLSATMAVSDATPDITDAPQKVHSLSEFTESSPGAYVSTFTSGTTPDTVIVQPLIDGTVKLATAKIIEEPTVSIATLSALDASATSALADGTTALTLTARVTDQHNKPLADKTIHWSADKPQALLSAADVTSGADGTAMITVTSRDVISTVVTATLDGGNSLTSPQLNFTANVASAQVSAISSNTLQVVANNRDSAIITAVVQDASEHPVEGVTVNWAIDKSDGNRLGQRTSLTNAQGIATTELKSAKVGTVKVAASVNNGEPKQTDTITFVADKASQQVSAITLSKPQAIADGTDSIIYEATVSDGQGNVVPGATVSWSVDNSDARLSMSQSISDDKGKSYVTLTSLKAGTAIVTAQTSESTPLRADKATFTADAASAHLLKTVSDSTTALADGSDAITITTTVVDANNNPLEGAEVNWSVSPAGGTLSGNLVKTNAQGVAEVKLTSTQVATYSVTASTNGDSQSVNNLSFTVDNSTAHLDKLEASANQTIADGQSTITLTAHLIDNAGHSVPGETVSWSADKSAAVLSAAQSVTNDQGEVQITVTSSEVIDTIVTAKYGETSSMHTDTLRFTVDEASLRVISVVSNKTNVVANDRDSATITATVLDDNQHPLAGVTVNWAISKTDGTPLGQRTSLTNSQGIATTELKSAKVGAVSVSASVNNGAAKQSDTITFVADTASQQVSAITLSKTQAVANGTDNIIYEATVTDALGNPVPGSTVSWSASPGNVQLNNAQTVSDANGKSSVIVTSLKATEVILTAQTSATTPLQSEKASFIADKLTAKVVEVSSDRSSALANGTDKLDITAKVTDANDNSLADMDVQWQKSPNSGTFSATSSKTDASGLAHVSLSSTDVATYNVTAESNGSSKTLSDLTFTGDNATAQVLSLTADKTDNVVAEKDHVTLSALVVDANQHPLANVTVNWSSSDEANAIFTPGASSVTNDQGMAVIVFSTLKAGNVDITANANNSSKLQSLKVIGNVETARFTAVEPDKYTIIANNSDAGVWTATVADANGNLLSGLDVVWSASRSEVTLSPDNGITDTAGKVSTQGTTLKSGPTVVTAHLTSGVSTEAKTVNFIGDVNTAKFISITHSTDHVPASTGSIVYTVTVQDANGNAVTDADVTWETTLNNLSATTTKTDSNGMARVSVSGQEFGKVTVTASINATSISDDAAVFMGSIDDDWDISQSLSYNGATINQFPSLGFLATGSTTGPTSLTWNGSNGESTLTAQMVNLSNGGTHTVTFHASRVVSGCGRSVVFNDAVKCQDGRQYPRLIYSQDYGDNAQLPPGTYKGIITFDGKDWHTSWAIHYTITTELKVD